MGIRRGEITTDIVRNGLEFNVDPANRASYVPDATIVFNTTDLSESGSLENGIVFLQPPISASCWDFDGTDDFIDFGSFPEYSNVSVSCWINIKARTNYGRIIQKGSLSESGWGIFQSAPAQKLEAFYYTGSTLYITRATNDVNLNEWVNFAFTYSSGLNPIIYINGVAETFASGLSSVGSSSNNLEIGRKAGAASALYNGNMANVQIYNRTLSAEEVLRNYNGLKGRFGL